MPDGSLTHCVLSEHAACGNLQANKLVQLPKLLLRFLATAWGRDQNVKEL